MQQAVADTLRISRIAVAAGDGALACGRAGPPTGAVALRRAMTRLQHFEDETDYEVHSQDDGTHRPQGPQRGIEGFIRLGSLTRLRVPRGSLVGAFILGHIPIA
jgi:hypothetical protein